MNSIGCCATIFCALWVLGCASPNDGPGASAPNAGGTTQTSSIAAQVGGNSSVTGTDNATMGGVSSGGSGPSSGGTGVLASSTKPAAVGGSNASSSGGSATTATTASKSAGCSSGKISSSCGKSGTTCSLAVNGKARTYYLQLPASYDPSKSYPVVFQFHPLTGTAEQALTMYNVSKGMPDAIYITPQGLKKYEQFLDTEATGWGNVEGEDIEFTLAMLEAAKVDYCVDTERVFATGFSYGGMMSYAIGCELGGTFRAIAPMAGATISGCNLSGKPIAMWGAHGTSDSVVKLTQGQQARDKILTQNNCTTETKSAEPSPCVEYQGCDSPVVWCEWAGDHTIPSFAASAIATFFKQF